jgi:hypothetical protein
MNDTSDFSSMKIINVLRAYANAPFFSMRNHIELANTLTDTIKLDWTYEDCISYINRNTQGLAMKLEGTFASILSSLKTLKPKSESFGCETLVIS